MTNGTAGSAASGVAPAPRRWRRTLHRLQLMVAVTLLVAIVTAALFPAVVAPSEPNAIDLAAMLQPPSLSHPFGTDALGRDIFSRAVHGAQVSLLVAVSAVALAGAGGAILGIVAAYYRGFIDGVLMRLADVQFSLPAVILAMVLVGELGALRPGDSQRGAELARARVRAAGGACGRLAAAGYGLPHCA
jgi:peptide/nickel transport system permease protein